MPTVTNLHRKRRSPRFFIERDRLVGGPFRGVLDSDRILEGEGEERGRLTLRQGIIDDPFLRAWILQRRAAGGEAGNDDYLDLVAVDPHGQVFARWILNELRVLEICDRRQRRDEDPSFDYIILEALARSDDR